MKFLSNLFSKRVLCTANKLFFNFVILFYKSYMSLRVIIQNPIANLSIQISLVGSRLGPSWQAIEEISVACAENAPM